MSRLSCPRFARAMLALPILATLPFLNGCAPKQPPPVAPGSGQGAEATIRPLDMEVTVVDLKGQRVAPEMETKVLGQRRPTIRTIVHPRADSRGMSREEANKRGTEALGINDLGQIVGDFIDRQGVTRGYVLESADRPKEIHDIEIAGATFTRAYAINNNGLIVGVFRGGDRVDKGFRVTLDEVRRAAGKPIQLEGNNIIDMGGPTQPLGVNDMGTVVGGFASERGRIRPFIQRAGERPQALPVPDTIAQNPFVSAFDITEEGFILGNYGEINGPGFFIRSRTFLLSPTGGEVGGAARAAQSRLVADFDVSFPATNSALGINDSFEMIGMCGPIGGSCGGNVSFYQTVSNPNPMRTTGVNAELTGTRVVMRVTNRVSTALSKINKDGAFVGTTDSPEGALVGLVGAVR